MMTFFRLNNSPTVFGPSYTAGRIGTLPFSATVTAPRFRWRPADFLVPLGKIPTTFPSFNRRIGSLIALGPGFSRFTGKALRWRINQFSDLVLNSSCFAI